MRNMEVGHLTGALLTTLVVLLPLITPAPGSAADKPRAWPPNQFAPVTPERIAVLPPNDRKPWQAYWEGSQTTARALPARAHADVSPLKPSSGPPKGGKHTKGLQRDAPRAWYASDEARTIADRVVARQSAAGAWTKGNDYTQADPTLTTAGHDVWSGGTFDNNATILELRFLVAVNADAPVSPRSAAWRAAYLRGLRYIFASQYPNGGFPQIYPLVGGYHDAVTFNDHAMTQVLEILRDVASGKPEIAFVPLEMREEAARRFRRGIACILATQLKAADGSRTVWCQQYDALTLQPSAARNFEPMAAAASESAEITRFLMSLPKPSPEVVASVEGAMAWFGRTAQHGFTWAPKANDGYAVPAPDAPPLWARYYELGTDKPIFGDRDRTIHYVVSELSSERRTGYGWYGRWPAKTLEAYATWRKGIEPTPRMTTAPASTKRD